MFGINAVVTTSGGSRELTSEELSLLTNGDISSSAFVLNTNDSIVVFGSFLNRYNLDSVLYKADSGTVSMYKTDAGDLWEEMSVSVDSNLYTSSVSGYSSAIKIKHTALSDGCNVYGVLFNTSGGSSTGFVTDNMQGISTTSGSITRTSISNNSTTEKTYYITTSGSAVSLGTSISGSFWEYHGDYVGVPSISSVWDDGYHYGTVSSGVFLVVSGSLDKGTYYSPVFDISSNQYGRVFYTLNGMSYPYNDYISNKAVLGVRADVVPPSAPWHSGLLAQNSLGWLVPSGSLPFSYYGNDFVFNVLGYNYIQFAITVSGNASVSSLGLELPLICSGVAPGASLDLYIKTEEGIQNNENYIDVWWV